MFKHILLPTDGSKLADRAIIHGIKLAKTLGAKVTLFTTIEGGRAACAGMRHDGLWFHVGTPASIGQVEEHLEVRPHHAES